MKVWGEIRRERPGMWQLVGAILIPLSAFVIAITFFWNFVHDRFEDSIGAQDVVIQSLEKRLLELSEEYNQLAQRTKGIFQPQLWKSEIIRDYHESFHIMGGLVGFTFPLKTLFRSMYGKKVFTLRFYNHVDSIDVFSDHILDIYEGEDFLFEVQGEKYFLRPSIPHPDSAYVKLDVYRLRPLYLNAEIRDSA